MLLSGAPASVFCHLGQANELSERIRARQGLDASGHKPNKVSMRSRHVFGQAKSSQCLNSHAPTHLPGKHLLPFREAVFNTPLVHVGPGRTVLLVVDGLVNLWSSLKTSWSLGWRLELACTELFREDWMKWIVRNVTGYQPVRCVLVVQLSPSDDVVYMCKSVIRAGYACFEKVHCQAYERGR